MMQPALPFDNIVPDRVPTPDPSADTLGARFLIFWKAYPRRVGKGAAEKAWKRIKPNRELLNLMLKAIEDQKKSPQWQKNNGEFIPHPGTWLNQKRWEDEIDTAGGNFDDETPSDCLRRMGVIGRHVITPEQRAIINKFNTKQG